VGILSEDLVYEAIQLAMPSIIAIGDRYSADGHGVVIMVAGSGIDQLSYETPGLKTDHRSDWEKFSEIAVGKLTVTIKYGSSSFDVVEHTPWVLEKGDCLYQGAVGDHSLAVAVSGLRSQVDEGIASVIWSIIAMLCKMEVRTFRGNKEERLPV
jgi:hypothetical protein